jgi:hypothetical protein
MRAKRPDDHSRCSGRLKATSRKTLIEALHRRVTDHHRFLLKLHLTQVQQLRQGMRDLEARKGSALEPFRGRQNLENLMTIPIVSDAAAHLISWAGLCPRLDESAGKHRSRWIRKGARGSHG